MRRTAAALVAAAVLFCGRVQAQPTVSARCAVLLDAASGRVLWEKNAREQALIASTTKIMTGLLIVRDCNLNDVVRVPKEAVGIEGSSLYLKEGEQLTVEALLYGMMLHSGNDAAAALAIHHSGSVEEFVDAMNRMARDLGLEQTQYANPHGLDAEENHSTALDLAKLSAYAMEDPVFHRVVSSQTAKFGNRVFTNHNKLLWRYEGAVGIKTGYTKSAGRILVSCTEREGRRLIAVTICAPDDWDDHAQLLDYGFSAFSKQEILHSGQIMGRVPVACGADVSAVAVAAEPFSCALAAGEQVVVRPELPAFVYLPVVAGGQVGTAVVYLNETQIARVPLVWRDTVNGES